MKELSLNIKGLKKYKSEEYEEALPMFDEAIELDPNYADAYFNRGMTHIELKNDELAIADLQKAMNLDDVNHGASVLKEIGKAQYRLGKYDAALQTLNTSADMDEFYDDLFLVRGLTKKALGDESGAQTDFARAVELGNEEAKTYLV